MNNGSGCRDRHCWLLCNHDNLADCQGEIDAVVHLPTPCRAKSVVFRLRHPDSKRIQSVTVQGEPSADFDPRQETITLVPAGETMTVRVKYAASVSSRQLKAL